MKGVLDDLPRGPGAVHLRVEGAWARLTIDNPDAANAISPGMMVDIAQHVEQLEASRIAAVLVHGSGLRAFCSGGDLRAVQQHLLDPGAAAAMSEVMGDVLDRLWRLPAVIVAAVEGAAVGGGAEILSACDVVFASDSAKIGFVHSRLGVSPGWGGGGRLVHRVGARHALQVLASGSRMTTSEALSRGLVDYSVAPGTAVGAAQSWCEALCAQPLDAIRGAARLVKTWRDDSAQGGSTERAVFAQLWGSPSHVEALRKVLGR